MFIKGMGTVGGMVALLSVSIKSVYVEPSSYWERSCLWAGIPSRYVTSQLGQLSLEMQMPLKALLMPVDRQHE